MSDPQPFAGPEPAAMVFVHQFAAAISAPGVLRLSTSSMVPVPGGFCLVAGPSLAMSVSDAVALVSLIQSQIAQAQSLAAQSGQPN